MKTSQVYDTMAEKNDGIWRMRVAGWRVTADAKRNDGKYYVTFSK